PMAARGQAPRSGCLCPRPGPDTSEESGHNLHTTTGTFRGIRDLLPLFVPLLTSGLERAMQLAESMEARGFGGSTEPLGPRREVRVKIATAMALLGLVSGFFVSTYFHDRQALGRALLALSLVTLLLVFRVQGQRVRRTRYRRDVWHRRDTLLATLGTGVATIVLVFRVWSPTALAYYPYPPLSPWPPFNPFLGGALALLVAPVVLAPPHREQAAKGNVEHPERSAVRSRDARFGCPESPATNRTGEP
ncbi:MAG: energy-coupling factor transporter transmembrane component T, partial [Chloroflexota bacterium]|nr:energy-coupling factor transporter transmembrane component T [Chloroflexota bacterium]